MLDGKKNNLINNNNLSLILKALYTFNEKGNIEKYLAKNFEHLIVDLFIKFLIYLLNLFRLFLKYTYNFIK